MELREFLEYTASLDFDTEPDYDRCRNFFKAGLKKRRLPCDGKLDFSATGKTPTAKKVGTTRKSSPVKRAASSPRKRTAAKKKQVETETESESDEEVQVVKKRTAKIKIDDGKKAKGSGKKKAATFKDTGCQTSPAFVAKAKAAAAAKKRRAANGDDDDDNDMDAFVEKAKKAARAAGARNGTPKAKGKASDDNGLANPTAAMLELMEKKAQSQTKKPRKN